MPDPGQPDFAALRQRAQYLYSDLQDVQDGLTRTQAVGHDPNGLVSASVAADGRLLELRIDPSVIEPENPEGLAAMVVAAVRDAHRAAVQLGTDQLAAVTTQLTGLLSGIQQANRSALPSAPPPFPAPPGFPASAGVRTRPARGTTGADAGARVQEPASSDPAAEPRTRAADQAPGRGYTPDRPGVAPFAPVGPNRTGREH